MWQMGQGSWRVAPKLSRFFCEAGKPTRVKRRSLSREEREAILLQGASVEVVGSVHLPYVEGVGCVDTLLQQDGRTIQVIYPRALFTKKNRQNLNFKETEEYPFRPPTKGSNEKLFRQGMRLYSEEYLHGVQYYYEDGLKKVRPYLRCEEIRVSDKSKGLTNIVDVCQSMYVGTEKLARYKLERGYVQVNFHKVDPDFVLEPGQLLFKLDHIHETPVLDTPIEILHEDDELLVVNKPASYILYPMGSTNYNSLILTLMVQKGHKDLRPIHRLDRLTSGVCMISKGPLSTMRLQKMIRSQTDVHKEYIALVDGEFPSGEILWESAMEGHILNSLGQVKTYTNPKSSQTKFERLSFDGEFSLVRCLPITGRTHQIRKHLLEMGHPVVNDDLYNPKDHRTDGNIIDNQMVDDALDQILARQALGRDEPIVTRLRNSQPIHKYPDCVTCEVGTDFVRSQLVLAKINMFHCLHAWKYRMGGYEFEAPWPSWARDPSMLSPIKTRRAEGVRRPYAFSKLP